MTIENLAKQVVESCERVGSAHMVTGAFAFNYYGVPRATRDVDVVVEIIDARTIPTIIQDLNPVIEFSSQIQFDTATWGKRHVGSARGHSILKVELFELFDDPFVMAQFGRRVRLVSWQLGRQICLPTAEDIVVQKLRWGRPKDLEDVRDLLAVQGIETLDLPYITKWCAEHDTTTRFHEIVASLPKF